MTLQKWLATPLGAFVPSGIRNRVCNESWQKDQIDVGIRDHEEALAIRTHPLTYLEVHFKVTNRLPTPLQVYGASVEIWLGKPVVQFYTFLSDQLRSGETRETLRAVTFLNPAQTELLNPPKKESPPPGCSVIVTVACRSIYGPVEKTVKTTWISPKVLP